MYTVYQNEVLCIFFLDDVNEYYSMKNSWLRYNFVLKMIDLNPDYLSKDDVTQRMIPPMQTQRKKGSTQWCFFSSSIPV